MEKLTQTVESLGNFEGNETLVLFSRLHNENIKRQIIDLLFQAEQSEIGTFVESLEVDENGDLVFDENDEPIIKEKVPYVPKTREELEESYSNDLAEIEASTEIIFSKSPQELHTEESMCIGAIVPWTDMPFTTKQMSIAEAHEKGHKMRSYVGTYFDEHFSPGFDFRNVPFGEDVVSVYRKVLDTEDVDKSDEEIKEMFFDYLTTPNELAERMSQLKNYFGIDSDAEFTKEHLDYAREHYIPDTGMDNGMKQFFQAITADTENDFLSIINSAGI